MSFSDPNAYHAYNGGYGAPYEFGFEIKGAEMQFVEIELDPGAAAVAEAGALMFKHPVIQMETVFGDGSGAPQGGFFGSLLGAGKRLLAGESLFTTVFTHMGHGGRARVAFAAPYPGKIIPIRLRDMGGLLICQKDSFLAASRGIQLGIHFQRRILTGLFGGEGFVMQRLQGDGLAFIHAGGTVEVRDLQPGEELHVDTGCLVAMTGHVSFDVVPVGGVRSSLFGGEGFFFARVAGPGRVWLQSLPFSRLAGRMMASAAGRGRSEEGSVLGSFGNLVDGDNS